MSPKPLHALLSRSMRWASHWSGVSLRKAHAQANPRILMYHTIDEEDVSAAQFEWQLEFLRRHFEPVSLDTLLDRCESHATTGREVVITFDDGVANHFTTAWPLLEKHRVPATFFVCPGLIESRAWLWRTELRMRLALLAPAERDRVARDAGCAVAGVEPIMEWTKRLAPDDLRAFQHRVGQLTRHFRPTARQQACHAPLTWDQIRQMDPALVTVGSHTATHPVLTTLSADELEQELGGSRKTLESTLGRTVDLFSYPNGANDPAVVAVARQHYRCALTTRQALVADTDDAFTLPRIPAAEARADFTRRMHRPGA